MSDVKTQNIFDKFLEKELMSKPVTERPLVTGIDIYCKDCKSTKFEMLNNINKPCDEVVYILKCKKCGRYKLLDKYLQEVI